MTRLRWCLSFLLLALLALPLLSAIASAGQAQGESAQRGVPQPALPILIFPFEPGMAWVITQGYATDSTHGTDFLDEKYAFDLKVAEKDTKGVYQAKPDKTSGKNVVAAAKGYVIWAQKKDDGTVDKDGGVLLRHDDYTEDLGAGKKKHYFTMYLHMQKIFVNKGDQVSQGSLLGEAGAVSSRYKNVSPHIHFHLFSSTSANGEGERTAEPLLRLQGWVVRDGSGKENYAKESWPYTLGEKNQYSGWVVSRTPLQTTPSGATSTILIVDVSESMSRVWQGKVKLDSAKDAATRLVNMMQSESTAGKVAHQVALVSFSDNAALNLSLTSDYAKARTAINGLRYQASTNIGAALQVANAEMRKAAPDGKHIIILLSDGATNQGLSREEIIAGPVQEAKAAGTCIYTVGFGNKNEPDVNYRLDEEFLKRIATEVGCGQYYYASDSYQLESVYIKVRHESTGNIIGEFAGQVRQGETVTAGQVEVKPWQQELRATLNWPGSKLDLVVTDPRGRRLDRNYPGITVFAEGPLVYIIVKEPLAGFWQIAVTGQEVPGSGTEYRVIVSTVQGEPKVIVEPALVAFLGLMLLLVLAVVVGIAVSRRPAYGPVTPVARGAGLRVVDGPLAGTFVPFRGGMLTIGRAPGHTLILPDPQVSHTHAHIVAVTGGLAIYDRNSRNGTFINGQRVPAASLRPGDEIRVGNTRLRFEVYG